MSGIRPSQKIVLRCKTRSLSAPRSTQKSRANLSERAALWRGGEMSRLEHHQLDLTVFK
jgi:hypothetical protein